MIAALRCYLDVRPLDYQERSWLTHVAETAADTRHVVTDIINVMLEELVHHRYELPAFSALDRLAIQAREKVHETHFEGIANRLDPEIRALIDSLFTANIGETSSTWNLLKRESKKTTNKETHLFLQHIRRLQLMAMPFFPLASKRNRNARMIGSGIKSMPNLQDFDQSIYWTICRSVR